MVLYFKKQTDDSLKNKNLKYKEWFLLPLGYKIKLFFFLKNDEK